MRGDRRTLTFHTTNVLSRFVYLCACLALTTSSEYGIPIEIKLWDTGRTPLAHMVDVTNEFGLKVLAEHNFLNDNNIAFSPYGLMGIMVALYEGVDGESSYQIQRGMQLPWNRNIMRIGFRDIHRTLKTYFVPEEGFLAGLALNNENVTFNDQYKKILRFYGFDLENDQLPTLSPETNNTSNETSAAATTMSPSSSGDSSTTAMLSVDEPSRDEIVLVTPLNREETTTTINPNAETISTIDIRGDTSTEASVSLAPNAASTLLTSAGTETTTSESATDMTTAVTNIQSTVPQTETPTPEQPTTILTQENTTTVTPRGVINSETTFASSTNEPTTNNEVDTSSVDMSTAQMTTSDASTSTTQTDDAIPSTIQSTTDNSNVESPTENVITSTENSQQTDVTSTMSDITTVTNSVTTEANNSMLETLERKKRSIVDFIFTNPPYGDDYDLYYRSYEIGSEGTKTNFDDKMFLANGLKNIQVTYMHYDTVLEHAYLPHLEASALRLPLDSDRYYLLVVLPTRPGSPEIGRLLSRMARESDLSDVYSVLRPRRVKGIVPSFIVKGHVTLTTDLQKLGIRDVFEPRQRDFTPMTKQAGVYVRSIEQAVSVAIRKYRPDDQKKHRYVTNRDPVVFSATYPFLYFVMDANIHVALMAGKMVDPLNSRIL
ncbi:unnamed protein product [Arctia plantaginis]|uniref:Serpin domain-containing protein n=1 Tax=Arctia plantaginis TaxID=874455 RepID=A0A8S0YRD9_ARCPL|nr:unnamed protein product [Arctia plantaginis]